MANETLSELVAREQADPIEADGVCYECGRESPCPTRRLADALAPLLGPDGTLPDVAALHREYAPTPKPKGAPYA